MQKNALAVLMVIIGLIGGTFIGWGITATLTPGGVQLVTIEITGSTTCEPVITTASEMFMAINPNVDISVTGTGSGSGIADTISGLNDIGMSSRNIKPDENVAKRLVMVCEQEEKFTEGINICQWAISRGLSDGTKKGFAGRLEKLKRQMAEAEE